MRPIRLEMEGFSSFRERTVVDFADAELFAFSGPTGAGKSSIIDAMVFALYGSVPRYGDDRLVGSAVNQQSSRALVDFEFAVGDDRFRVVREVRRQGRGGSTREARLERAGSTEPLFDGDARQLTGEVERLLGLTRDQFTKCVVLPQGDFQRFLHDKPGVRQDLLVQLLGVEIYSRVGELARQRRRAAAAQVEALDRQRQELEQVLADEPRLRDRSTALDDLQRVIDEVVPGLTEAEAALAAARGDLERLDGELARLGRVRRPDDLDDLAEAVTELDEELASLKAEEARHSSAEAEAEAALEALPHPRARLEEARAWHQRRADLEERIVKGERMVAEAAAQLRAAETALAVADEQASAAERDVEAARVEHAAAHLASGLAAGDPCPVCHRTIDEVPRHLAADLDEAEAARSTAVAARDQARTERDELTARHQSYAATLATRREERDDLGEAPVDVPAEQLEEHLAAVVAAERQVEAARLARRSATERREASERKRAKIAKLETGAWNEFDQVRDEVAALGPPPARRDDLAGSWADLHEWAEGQLAARARRRNATVEALDQLEQKRRAAVDALDQAFASAGLERPPEGWREVVAAEAARTTEKLEQVERAKEAAAARTAERDQAQADEQVAGEVGNLMKANAFEKWLLDEALEALVVGGSAKLDALSRGQYSFAVDSRGGLLVVDHHNAGETRSARTLSGGETFLASLALALALAEQVADLASQGAPRIESIFLDEGFGSLDPDTLEVVVAAIEELHASGLVVGLISHVPELAERVPTRFEVARGLEGSTVERIDR